MGSCVLWMTGLSGAGKTTLAKHLERKLLERGVRSYILDGDLMRQRLNKDLGYNEEDRKENIRRIGEVAKLFVDAGIITITALISPYREDRNKVRSLFVKGEFIEIYVSCPLQECEKRDPKGLYKKVRNGEIGLFTGISSPYEPPVSPEVTIQTDKISIERSVETILRYLQNNGYI